MKHKKWIAFLLSVMIAFSCFLSSSDVYAKKKDDESENSENLAEFVGGDLEDKHWETFMFIYNFILGEDFAFDPSQYMDSLENNSDIDETGGIGLERDKWNINRYSVHTEDLSGVITGNLNKVSNALMSVTHTIVDITDNAFQYLFTATILNDFADSLRTVSESIYDTLKDKFAELFFIILIAYLAYLFFAKGNLQAVLKKSLVFVCVVLISGYWVLNAGFLLKTINYWADEGQGSLVDAGNSILDLFGEKEGVFADAENIDEENTLEGTVSLMRNIYFDLAIKRPYLMINYGETDEKKINEQDKIGKKYGWGFDNYSRVDRMLSFNLTSEGMSYRSLYAKAEAVHEGNNNMSSGGAYKQFGLVLLTLVTTIFISVPFAVLGGLNFILQLLILAIAFVIPFVAIISYIPHFSNTLFKTFGRMAGVIFLKMLLGIFLLFVYLVAFLVNKIIPPETTGMYYLNVIALAGILYYLFIKRDAVISLMTAGYVTSLDKNIMSNLHQGMEKAKNNIQNNGKDFKRKLMPTKKPRKPSKPVKYDDKDDNPSDGKGEKNSKAKTGKGVDNQVERTPQLSKTDKENSRVAKNSKLTPIERTKQMLSRRRKGQPDKKQQNKKNQSEEITKKQNSNDKKKPTIKKPMEPMELNKDYKANRNSQLLESGEKTGKPRRNLGYGVYNIGEEGDIDTKQKTNPVRNVQSLDLKNRNHDRNQDLKEGVNKSKNKNLNYESRLYNQYDVERNKEIESVEQKKKDRNIDKELS